MAALEGSRFVSYKPKNNQNFSNRKRNSEASHQSEKIKQVLQDLLVFHRKILCENTLPQNNGNVTTSGRMRQEGYAEQKE